MFLKSVSSGVSWSRFKILHGRWASTWTLNAFNTDPELQEKDVLPPLDDPKGVLVEVHASSINPIDNGIKAGYGRSILGTLRRLNGLNEMPLILGRDFSGVVQNVGRSVSKFKPGDEVWGAVGPDKNGSHRTQIQVLENEISFKPKKVDHLVASSLPYVTLTAWSALCCTGGLNEHNCRGKRILILGGSGGIGTFALQLLKAWHAEVVVTCSPDSMDLLIDLGADVVIDRTQDLAGQLKDFAGFDFIFDCVGDRGIRDVVRPSLKAFGGARYVTILSPLMVNSDNLGFFPGLAKSAFQLGTDIVEGLSNGRLYGWAFYMNNAKALEKVADLVDAGKIKPVIDSVFDYENILAAYAKTAEGHNRGKTVVKHI